LNGVELTIASDVNNVFVGKNGAVEIFSRQKGANKEDQIILERGMNNVVEIFKKENQIDLSNMEFSGAAGVKKKINIDKHLTILFFSKK
jgi:glycerate 2-kinase